MCWGESVSVFVLLCMCWWYMKLRIQNCFQTFCVCCVCWVGGCYGKESGNGIDHRWSKVVFMRYTSYIVGPLDNSLKGALIVGWNKRVDLVESLHMTMWDLFCCWLWSNDTTSQQDRPLLRWYLMKYHCVWEWKRSLNHCGWCYYLLQTMHEHYEYYCNACGEAPMILSRVE